MESQSPRDLVHDPIMATPCEPMPDAICFAMLSSTSTTEPPLLWNPHLSVRIFKERKKGPGFEIIALGSVSTQLPLNCFASQTAAAPSFNSCLQTKALITTKY